MLLARYEKEFPEVIACLKRARVSGRMAHAYLLHGDSPELRRNFSLVLSQIAICPNNLPDGTPCGTCRVCRHLESGIYAEFYELMPTGKTWQIQVGERRNPEPNTVRWFESQFYLTSTSEASKKVGVIYDADRMNTESQNAFLKTLEEPPSDSFFILATGNPSALLPTTRSRCQTLILLENRCLFEFEKSRELFAILYDLQFKAANNITAAGKCAENIINIAQHLQEIAEATAEKLWKERLTQAEELESPIKKRIEKQFESAVAGEYIKVRNYFTGAIHTWFAQVYQLSCGVPFEKLANPEIFNNMQLPDKIAEKRACHAMTEADQLLYNLLFNVSEELAFRSFCLNVAVK